MRVTINGYRLDLQENDTVEISHYECETCGGHTEVDVERNGKRIAHFGDAISIHANSTGGEIFGGVLLDSSDNLIKETLIHCAQKGNSLTPDGLYYIALCGKVLNEENFQARDSMTGTVTEFKTGISKAQQFRKCHDCEKIIKSYERR